MTSQTDITYRDATSDEIAEHYRHGRARYRHFTREIYAPNSKNGVQHRQHSSAKVRLVEGRAVVRHHGRDEELVGDRYSFTGTNGKEYTGVTNLRLRALDEVEGRSKGWA